MRRFFVPPENVGENTIIIDDRNDLHHMIRVLRISEGDRIAISDSQEWEYQAELVRLDSDGAEAAILDKQRFTVDVDIDPRLVLLFHDLYVFAVPMTQRSSVMSEIERTFLLKACFIYIFEYRLCYFIKFCQFRTLLNLFQSLEIRTA